MMGRNVSGILLTGGALAAAILLLTLLPLSTAATTQPLFRPMALPDTVCPPNTAQRFDQEGDGGGRFLDRTGAATDTYSGTLMVPAVFAGRQAWLILRITNLSPGGPADGINEVHELFLTNERGETIFLGVIDESTNPSELIFQIPQDFLTAGMNNITLQLDESSVNQDPAVVTGANGGITIDSMRVCYGGYYVYEIPIICGFTPVDLKEATPPDQEPLTAVPAIKQGDYATNVIVSNHDFLKADKLTAILTVEFALVVNPLGGWTNHYDHLDIGEIIFFGGTGVIDGLSKSFGSCDVFDKIVRTKLPGLSDNKVFWKGVITVRQPIGDGITTSKVPLSVQAVYSYELTVNKIRYQILRDPSDTIPRHLIGQDLEMLIAVNPLNKTDLGSTPFDSFQTMRVIRENIRTQYPAAADRATIRVIEVNVGVGGSQTIARIEPTETPLETPAGVRG